MSLSRLAVRLAAIEALCPSASIAAGPYPTLAGNKVYDSRVTPIADEDSWQTFLEEIEGDPLVIVYTEEQETEPTEGEYPADREFVELVVETMIAGGAFEVTNADGSVSPIGSPEAAASDPEREAMLDVLDAQIRALLDPASPLAPTPYAQIAMELHHARSAPMRDSARTTRVAARTLTFKLRIVHALPYATSPAGTPEDIASLPKPLLQVALAVDRNSAAGQMLRSIAKQIAAAPTPTLLRDIRIFANVDRGAAPTATVYDIEGDSGTP